MANNLCRILGTTIEITNPRLTLSFSNSVSRLISSTTQKFQIQQEDNKNGSSSKNKEKKILGDQDEVKRDHEEESEKEDYDMNKQTGEVGGPRGPEPTRYGDWEKNGRCSDF